MPAETAYQVARWLTAHRKAHDARPWQRAATPFVQAVMVLRWFKEATDVRILARDARVSIATGYRYLHEAIDVIAAHTPELPDALADAVREGWAFVCLDGTLIPSTRCSAPADSGHDLWYSGKHKQHGGNIQVLTGPTGYPEWVSEVEPGSTHDITAAREHALPALYPAATQGLPTLTDKGYTGAGIGIMVPTNGRNLSPDNQARNTLISSSYTVRSHGPRSEQLSRGAGSAAGVYNRVMVDLNGAEDHWLEGGVDPLAMGAENGFQQEVDRVVELLGGDESWLAWWRRTSKAPVLELHMIVVRAAYDGAAEERVVRGRKRHLVEMHVDFHELEALEPDERRLLALPAVLEGVSRAQQALKLSGEHPTVPDSVRPAPLSAGTVRRRRLRELRGETNAPLLQNPFADRDDSHTRTPTVRSVRRPREARLTPTPTVASPDPTGGQPVVEIHVPLKGAGGIPPDDPRYEFGWIDVVEEFLDDESSDGSFNVYDDGEEIGGAYVFFVAGAPEEVLLSVAADVAALPGVPSDAFAVVADEKSEDIGTGRRVALS